MRLQRKQFGVLGLVMVLTLVATLAEAADKKTPPSASYENNPTIGVLGAHRGQSDSAAGTPRMAAPSAPVAVAPPPKVEAEPATVPSLPHAPPPAPSLAPTAPTSVGGTPSALPAAPRPEARVEGSSSDLPVMAPTVPSGPPNAFLADHPFISGLLAGLVGTGLGSIIYGGPMQGDETAAFIGFMGRVGVVLLLAGLALRAVARQVGRAEEADLPPAGPRREPHFGPAAEEEVGGRREPTFGRSSAPDRDRSLTAPRRGL